MQSLDNILSTGGEAVTGQEQEKEQVTQQAGEGETQTQQATESQTTEGDGDQKMVPHAALHAEKQKVRRYTEEVADFRKQLQETNATWERRMAQLVEAVTPKQQPPPAPTEFFENPDKAFDERIGSVEAQRSQREYLKDLAITRQLLGADKVDEAIAAFDHAYKSGTISQADLQELASAPVRPLAAVQWYQRQQVQAEIGNDPAAYRERVKAEIRKELEAELQQGGQQTQQRQATPSNLAAARTMGSRSGPAWSGPTPMQDIFSRIRPEQ